MRKTLGSEGPQWVTLRAACRILGVNETTLRNWADDGKVRAFRTPGGHRRFSVSDLHALTQRSTAIEPSTANAVFEDAALIRVRRRLHPSKTSKEMWMETVGEKGRLRFRALGRRLLRLVDDYQKRRKGRPALREEARAIGTEHGEEVARLGLGLMDAFRAFVFFRNTLLDTLSQLSKNGEQPPIGVRLDQWRQILALMDEVELAVAEAYQNNVLRRSHGEKATSLGA